MYTLADGVKIDLMKHCIEPCYQVKVIFEERSLATWDNYALLNIYGNVETVRVLKAVYSFDIFMLMVELGSALGLWLGRNHSVKNNTFYIIIYFKFVISISNFFCFKYLFSTLNFNQF